MYVTTKSMSEKLVGAKLALTNALEQTDIKEALAEMGFTEARLNEGLALYQATDTLYQQQKREYTDQYLASEALQNAWGEAQTLFKKYATAAKLALMDQETLRNSLGLHRNRRFGLADWIILARTFYGTALQSTAILELLSEFAVTVEKLQAGLQLVETVESLRAKRDIEKSEAQQITKERDDAFSRLDKYMYQLTKVARVVLQEKPEHLEKIGILYRSAPIRKKKEENETEEGTISQETESLTGKKAATVKAAVNTEYVPAGND